MQKRKILIADCGGSKCEWAITTNMAVDDILVRTNGYNPQSDGITDFLSGLGSHPELGSVGPDSRLYFFGAGLVTGNQQEIVRKGLSAQFSIPVSAITVQDDLMAASLAAATESSCLVSILGTGTNAGLFSDGKLYRKTPSLGFILGDEGGGAYFGKRLLSHYYYRQMPQELARMFEQTHRPRWVDVLPQVYHNPGAASFLASLVPFLAKHITHPFVDQILRHGFQQFIENRILVYEDFQAMPLHFTGGVAAHFEKIIREVADEYGIHCGRFLSSPMPGLISKLGIKKAV